MFLRLVQQQLRAKPRSIIGQALTLASQGILALLQRSQKTVSLKLKLLFSPLYLLSSVYIFIRFINSLPKPWFQFYLDSPIIIIDWLIGGWFCCADKIGYIGSIVSRVGFVAGEVKIRVSVVLVLVLIPAKLFLRRYLIYPKLNSPLVAIYSLTLSLVYSIGSSSYRVLNSDWGTIVFLYFLTYTLLVRRNV